MDTPATGHKWSETTTATDALEGATKTDGKIVITVGTETYTYDNVAAAKAALAGWTTKTAANCTEKGEMVRTCSVCGETESAELNALGHYVSGMADGTTTLDAALKADGEKAVCKVDPALIAADGTANYAFICERENCPCNVVIDAIGTTAHYVPVVDHSYTKADGTEVEWTTTVKVTCTTDGKEVRNCTRCEHPDERVVKSTGHVWNEKQLSGTVDAIVCSPDPDLNGNDVTAAVAKVLRAMYTDDVEYAAAYDKMVDKYEAFTSKNPTAQISRFCTVCFDFEAAKEHSWIVSALQDGKYGLNDYTVDEEGNPVPAEGVTAATMNCRYVLVCEHCKTVSGRGAHGESSKASCRDGGYCKVCGQQTEGQSQHLYYNIDTIKKNAEASQTANTKVDTEDFTWKELFAAYEKVVATEGWMAPTDGSCNTPGQDVSVCVKCLMDASKGEEVAWTENTHAVGTNETLPDDSDEDTVYYAYTESFEAAHKYETVYFNLKAKDTNDTANMIKGGKDGTDCEFGFKVAYICSECNNIYKNEPKSDDTTTVDKNEAQENNKYQDISLNGEDKKGEFTDANGFILKLEESTAQEEDFNATTAKVDNHQGAHSIYVPVDYKTLASQYKAPNCAEYAQLPVVCENCGATLQYTVEELKAWTNANTEFKFAETVDAEEGYKLDTTNVFTGEGALANEAKYNENNHAGTPFDCGEHCNYAVKAADGKSYTAWCHAFGDTNTSVDADKLEKAYHATVEVTIKLSSSVKYTDGYTLHVATVTDESIVKSTDTAPKYSVDWTKATITDTDKASKCSGSADKLNQYTLPVSYVESEAEIKEGTKYLVVKDAAGKYYGLSDIAIYADTAFGEGDAVTGENGYIKVTEDDTFFIKFTKSVGIPGVAVKADSAEALEYAVANNPTTPEGTGDNAKTVLNITITNDISVTDIPNIQDRTDADEIDKVTYDLGGKKLSTSQTTTYAWDADGGEDKMGAPTFTGYEVVFKNGTIEFTSDKVGASKALLAPIDDAALTLDNVTLTTKSGTAIFAKQGSDESTTVPTVTIKNSTLNVGGAFGVSTNASYSTADTSAVVVTIENSTITMNPENKTGNAATDNTALFINVPAKVSVKNSTLSANRQVVVARGGQTVIENSELILREGYVSPESWVDEDGYIKQDKFDSVKGDRTIASIQEWRPYMTQQNYRMAGIWDQGNELPQGVLVMGNSNTTAYKYTTSVDVTKDVEFTNQTSMPNIVIGSYHSAEIMGNAGDYKEAVWLKTAAGFTGISYCSNWVEGTVEVNGTKVTK